MKFKLLNNWVIQVKDVNLNTITQEEAILIGKKIISNLVVVIKNQNLSEQDELDFCSKIGDYQKSAGDRTKHLHLSNGILRVTGQKNEHGEEGLFGHTSALDWHANQASNKDRMPLIWLYGVEGTQGSRTSWINNKLSYDKLPSDLKEQLQDTKITLGYKSGSYSPSKFFKEHHHTNEPFNLVHTNDAGLTGLYFPYLQVFGGLEKELFEKLKEHILKDEFVYHHNWEDGDVVISEQWLSIHKRWKFDKMDTRILHRIGFDYSKCLEV